MALSTLWAAEAAASEATSCNTGLWPLVCAHPLCTQHCSECGGPTTQRRDKQLWLHVASIQLLANFVGCGWVQIMRLLPGGGWWLERG